MDKNSQLQEIYKQLQESAELQDALREADKTFSFKPFAVEYAPLRRWAKGGRWALACFSVVTGFTALYFPMAAALWAPIAGVLALVILAALESLKSFFLEKGFKQVYTPDALPYFLLPAAAALAASVFLSLTGVEALYRQSDDQAARIESDRRAALDSLEASWEARIAAAQQEADAYKKANQYGGVITYAPDNRFAKRYEALISRSGELREEQKSAAAALDAQYKALEKKAMDATEFNAAFWVVLSGINEALILASLWFLIYYQRRLQDDRQLLSDPPLPAFQFPAFQFPPYFAAPQLGAAAPSAEAGQTDTGPPPPPPAPPATAPKIGFPIPGRPPESGPRAVPYNNESGGNDTGTIPQTKIVSVFLDQRECPNCGAKFLPNHKKQIYCSSPCRLAFYKKQTP